MRPYPNYYQNPNFYQNNYMNPNSYRNDSPFTMPRMGQREMNGIPKKGFTLSSALANAEKGIDTISSIIPIYQKVKPVIENGKDIVNVVKQKFNKKKEKPKEKVDVEIVDEEAKEKQNKNLNSEENLNKKEETKPNKPFFDVV